MNVILVGYGKMGKMIEQSLMRVPGAQIIGVVHPGLFESPMDVPEQPDVIIDFSYPGNLQGVLERAIASKAAVVIGTTGYTAKHQELIRMAAQHVPIMISANYSVGVALLRRAVEMVSQKLMPEFDVEIVETHHNQKADAPSGTAKMLLNAVDPAGDYAHVFGREGIVGARTKEIGVHAVRGGTVAGEHSVFFFGEDELLEFRHSAASRKIFANGAVRAAEFVLQKGPGLYGIDDVINL